MATQLMVRVSSAYSSLLARLSREEGQALVEYMLLLALISLAAIGIMHVLGTTASSFFSRVKADFP